jgi:hypothetical protein
MNHKLWAMTGARVLALSFVIAGVSACGDRTTDTRADASSSSTRILPSDASPSAVVIGQAPSATQGDTAQTTPPAGAQGDVSKAAESTARPIEGDNHSYSTLAPVTPQKADGVNRTGNGASGEGKSQ